MLDNAINQIRTYTKHGPGSMDHPMDLVHGPPDGRGPWTTPWTWSMDPVHGPSPWTTPWTTPYFQKEIAPVNMKIYRKSGYEKQILLMSLRVCLVIAGCFKLKALEQVMLPSILPHPRLCFVYTKTKYTLCSSIKITSYPMD